MCALLHKTVRGGETYPTAAAGYECYLPFELACHADSPVTLNSVPHVSDVSEVWHDSSFLNYSIQKCIG
jgi:hypothetical protein